MKVWVPRIQEEGRQAALGSYPVGSRPGRLTCTGAGSFPPDLTQNPPFCHQAALRWERRLESSSRNKSQTSPWSDSPRTCFLKTSKEWVGTGGLGDPGLF